MPPQPDSPEPLRPLRTEPTDFERLATIRFPLILLLVFLHNDRGGEFTSRLQDAPVYAGIVDWLARGLGGIRVPAFFLIGGYVFFLALKPTAAGFVAKIRSRAHSLLIPLVAWNLLGLAALALAQQLPAAAALLTPGSAWTIPVLDFGGAQLLEAVFGTPRAQPFVYPLWFLRDLFILVLLSPAIWWGIRTTHGWLTLVVLAAWIAGVHPYLVAADAFAFYFIGSHVAIARKSLFTLDRLGPAATVGWVLLQIGSHQGLIDLHPLKSALGVVAVLYMSGPLARHASPSRWMNAAAHYSFFIFVAHEPLLTFTRKASFALLHPRTPPQWLAAYLGGVVFVIVTLIAVFKLCERIVPRLLLFMTGGRSATPVTVPTMASFPEAAVLRSESERLG